MYEFKVNMIYIYEALEKMVLSVVSDECISEGDVPTVTSESAGSSLDPAVRSVRTNTHIRVCVCGYFTLTQNPVL